MNHEQDQQDGDPREPVGRPLERRERSVEHGRGARPPVEGADGPRELLGRLLLREKPARRLRVGGHAARSRSRSSLTKKAPSPNLFASGGLANLTRGESSKQRKGDGRPPSPDCKEHAEPGPAPKRGRGRPRSPPLVLRLPAPVRRHLPLRPRPAPRERRVRRPRSVGGVARVGDDQNSGSHDRSSWPSVRRRVPSPSALLTRSCRSPLEGWDTGTAMAIVTVAQTRHVSPRVKAVAEWKVLFLHGLG